MTGSLLLALALARLLEVPARPFQVSVLGSPLGVNLSETTVLLLVIGGMAVTGIESLVRAHPLVRAHSAKGEVQRTVVFWIVPALLTMALAAWLSRIANVGLWTLGLVAAAVLIPLALLSEYAAVSPEQRRDTWLQWAYSVLIHLVGLILFSVLYDARLRGLVEAPLLFIAATMLASRMFWALTNRTREAVIYGIVAGIPVAQLALVLNYWPLSGLQGGLVLLLVFYVMVGLLQHNLTTGRLEKRMVLEYGGVALLGLLALLIAVP